MKFSATVLSTAPSRRFVITWLALGRFFAKGRADGNRSADILSAVSQTSIRERAASTAALGSITNTLSASTPGGLETHDPGGKISSLLPFRDEWLALRGKHPEVFTVSADEIDAWHRHEAWRCESRKAWSNAVHHLTELLKTHPDSGDFLPRRAAAQVEWADNLLAAAAKTNVVKTMPITITTPQAKAVLNSPEPRGLPPAEQARLRQSATNLLDKALADYHRALAWVDRFPAIAKESRKPFVEKRREVYLRLGRQAEAAADARELQASPGE